MSVNNFNPKGYYLKRQGNEGLINFFKTCSILGRDEKADINLDKPIASRFHCKIEFDLGKMWITDMKSQNGTFVNSEKIMNRKEIKENDLIGIGCKTEKLQQRQNDFLVYKVAVMERISLDSDSEDAVEKDIESLCEELAKDSGIIPHTNGFEECINVSSDEETEIDKTWKEKLSQPKSLNAEKMLVHHKHPSPTPSSFSSPPHCSNEEADSDPLPAMQECSVSVKKLSKKMVQKCLEGVKDEDSESSNGKKNATKKYKARKKHKSNESKRHKRARPEDDKEEAPLPPKIKKYNEEASARDGHQSGATNDRRKMQIRRKSVSEWEVVSGEPPIARNTNHSRKEEVEKRPMPKRRMTVCGVEQLRESVAAVKSNLLLKAPVPIIEAPKMPKRRSSTHEPNTSSRRLSVFEPKADMFAIAGKMRKQGPQRRMSVDTSLSRQQTEQLKKERSEKLRRIAEEKRSADQKLDELEKTNKEKTDRGISKVKVKYTEKNRGDFLTSLPAVAEKIPKKPNLQPHLSKDPPEPLSSMLSPFLAKHGTRSVKSATVENGICNNLEFYSMEVAMETDVENKIESARQMDSDNIRQEKELTSNMGFYNQISFSQQSQAVENSSLPLCWALPLPVNTSLKSIYKDPGKTYSKKMSKVVFAEGEDLEKVRFFEIDLPMEPEESWNNNQAQAKILPAQSRGLEQVSTYVEYKKLMRAAAEQEKEKFKE